MTARLVIAGTQSGVGKTTLTTGLIAALKRQGLSVQPYKTGPDYIDPSYLSLAAGRPCRNLDTWMVDPDRVVELFAHFSNDADIALVEGVMGLYDGFDYQDESGSTAQVAKLLRSPVVLVLNASHVARSAGALALGFRQYDPQLSLAGFIVNKAGGEKHGRGVATAVQEATGLPVFGWLPRVPALEIPERHLGLVPTAEPGRWRNFIESAAAQVTRYLDLERVLTIARNAPDLVKSRSLGDHLALHRAETARPVTIAVARDEAFSFTYEENLDLLRAAGAEIVFFSPLRDSTLPRAADCIVLSGGFPELYAAQLGANTEMREAVRQAHDRRTPIYAECGGLMYLTETIRDLDGQEHPMVGLLPGHSLMTAQLNLGYRTAQAVSDSWLLAAGVMVRGHEFHYSVWDNRPDDLPPPIICFPPMVMESGARKVLIWATCGHLTYIYTSGASRSWLRALPRFPAM